MKSLITAYLNALKESREISPSRHKLCDLADFFAVSIDILPRFQLTLKAIQPYSTVLRIECDQATFQFIDSCVNAAILWIKSSTILPEHLSLRYTAPYAVGLYTPARAPYQALQAAYMTLSFLNTKGREEDFRIESIGWSITENDVSVVLLFNGDFEDVYEKRYAKCSKGNEEGISFFNKMPVSTLLRQGGQLKQFTVIDKQWQIIQ